MNEPYNAADAKQVKKRERKANSLAEQHRVDLAQLLQDPVFRRYIWRVIHEYCGVMQSAFSTNGSSMTFQVGMQDLGKRIWAEIEQVNAKSIPQMMIEYQESREQA